MHSSERLMMTSPTWTQRRDQPSHQQTKDQPCFGFSKSKNCIFGDILEHLETQQARQDAWHLADPPSLCVCAVNRFGTSSWNESLLSELPAGVSTSNARTSTDLHAQAQMQKVYKSTRPHIKHKEPLSDILNRWGSIPKHKCTVIKRLLSEAEL